MNRRALWVAACWCAALASVVVIVSVGDGFRLREGTVGDVSRRFAEFVVPCSFVVAAVVLTHRARRERVERGLAVLCLTYLLALGVVGLAYFAVAWVNDPSFNQ